MGRGGVKVGLGILTLSPGNGYVPYVEGVSAQGGVTRELWPMG